MSILIGLAIFLVLLIGVLVVSNIIIVNKLKRKEICFRSILTVFYERLWVTFGVGGFFFAIYLLIIYFGRWFDSEKRLAFFFEVYKNPVYYVNVGLWIFVIFSLGIYFARIVIKYLYETRNRS